MVLLSMLTEEGSMQWNGRATSSAYGSFRVQIHLVASGLAYRAQRKTLALVRLQHIEFSVFDLSMRADFYL